jgi:arylsulfatase A
MQQGGKTTLTDWGTRVPLLVRWPKVVLPGQTTDALVDMSDFLPTVAELAEYQTPAAWDVTGQSFVPVLRGQSKSVREWAFSERTDIKLDGKNPANTAWVRTQRWKLYLDGRLIDMDADRDEQNPIAEVSNDSAPLEARQKLQQVWVTLLK